MNEDEDNLELHHVTMAVRSIRSAVDDLSLLIPCLSDHDTGELEIARYDLEQLLLKARYPILQKGAA